MDSSFLATETTQLAFNFTSLQLYELLLVTTAVFLAWRRVCYDSTLLVGLENLLVLVPFILISQAALIDRHLVWALCLVAGLLAIGRFSSVRRFIPQLKLPTGLSLVALAVLVVNAALPVVYRLLHEYKVGKNPTAGAAYDTNLLAWLVLLPVLCALANLVPRPRRTEESPPRPDWLPLGLFSLWILATGVHLYCLGYVYDFALRPELLAPAFWVLLWTSGRLILGFLPTLAPVWRRTLLTLPLLGTALAFSEPGNYVFLSLTILNAAIYGSLCLRHRDAEFARHLFFVSLVALIAGLPEGWGRNLLAEFSRAKAVGASMAAYLLLWTAVSRNPKLGLVGALVAASIVMGIGGDRAGTFHWGIQTALAFLLTHSLRWVDTAQAGAGAVRFIASLAWMAHTVAWMHAGGQTWMACAVATPVLVVFVAERLAGGRWGPWMVPVAAAIVMLSGPGDSTAGKIQSLLAGLLAIAGSFFLLFLGTVTALTKHRWLRPEHCA